MATANGDRLCFGFGFGGFSVGFVQDSGLVALGIGLRRSGCRVCLKDEGTWYVSDK